MIVQPVVEPMDRFTALRGPPAGAGPGPGGGGGQAPGGPVEGHDPEVPEDPTPRMMTFRLSKKMLKTRTRMNLTHKVMQIKIKKRMQTKARVKRVMMISWR